MLSIHLLEDGKGLQLLEDTPLASAWPGLAGRSIWVDVEDPTDAEARALADVCGFHHLTVEDALTPVQPPKVEEFEGYLFLLFRGLRPTDEGFELESYKLAVYLGPSFLVTVHRRPVAACREVSRLVLERDLPMESQMDRVLHALVDRMMDEILPILDRFEERLEELEEAVFSRSPHREVLQELLGMKRQLLTIRRLVAPQREMLGRLARRDLPFIEERTSHYFRDVYDHVARMEETTMVLTDLASGALEAQLSVASNRLNEIVKVLTIFSAIWMPLTFLAGVYGMNFEFLPELKIRWFYPALWGAWIAIAAGMLAVFRWRRWI
ncbi:MAG TPA: magnesium/cobalt transporter CorA [Thermoanaerobaculia bacterium]|jgi:magnesium transporter|nr:magnesium/cobalt transporter CorA [Thermoanaerobaculia bacterium]HPA50662.1 magnesium/cobalt transporter CorA [Thermoanaerobaculia bacterium]HQN07140.1 magnesium/cobalt transporter CorA [Thermoanaerobaculia bacterium]HQP85705.1 magnesium/cobalt transporter CorA [Thermoanaerobaculia bacterium]